MQTEEKPETMVLETPWWMPSDSISERRLVSVLVRMVGFVLSQEGSISDGEGKQLSFELMKEVPRKRKTPGSQLRETVEEVINKTRQRKIFRKRGYNMKQLRMF